MNGETYTDTMYPGYVTWNWDPNATQYTLRVYKTGMSYAHSGNWAYDAPYCNPMKNSSNWDSGSYTMTLQASDETGVYTASETAALTLDYHPTETLAVPSLSVDGRTATILPNAGNDGKVRDYCIIIRVKTAEIERDFWDYTDGTTYWLPQWYVEQYPGAAFSVAVRARSNDLLQCRDSGNSAFYPLTIPELDTPLDPQWITQSEGAYLTGFIQFTESANTCGRYRIDLFEVGEGLVGTYELDTGGRPGETVPYRDHFYDLSAPASYYFVVTSLPDENSLYAPSLGARSPEWRFDPPQKYTAVTRAAWQGDLATWEYPYGEMQGDGLLVEWLVGPDPDHLIPEQKSFLTFHPDVVTAQMPNRLYSWRDSDCYFAFRVRLYSTRLETAAHGDWVYSEPMHLQASSIQTTQTIDRLNLDSGDLLAIQETLEALPSQNKLDAWQELPEAMRTSVVALEEKANVQVTVEADTSVQVVGLGLSAVDAAKAVTLTVTQEERTLQLLTAPEMDERNFQNAIDVTFEATNVKDELVIPVQISLPVSTEDPDQLRLYKGDNLDEVPIILADGYVRFAVADLSETYVLAEANLLGEVTVNDKTVTVIAQAPTGTTLYAASYDEGGRMRDVATAPVAEGQISYTLSLTPGTSVRVFLLDDNQMPLCQTKVIEKS